MSIKLKRSELEALLAAEDPAEVMQEFFDDSTHADDVPLDSFCVMGGAPDSENSPEIQVLNAQLVAEHCSGVLTAYFDEVVYGGGCPDMPTVKPRQGDVSFKVYLEDGTITFD